MSELDNYTGWVSGHSEITTDTSTTSTTLTTGGTTETLNIDTSDHTFSVTQESGDITFVVGTGINPTKEMIRICTNGDIYIRGVKTINDIQVYKGICRFLNHTNAEAVDADELEQILKSRDYKKFYREHHKKHAQPGQTFIDYIRKQQNE